MWKHVHEATPRLWLDSLLNKRSQVWLTDPNQPTQQKPGIDMEFYQHKHCQLRLKGKETGHNEERLSHFWDSTGQDNRPMWLPKGVILQEEGRITSRQFRVSRTAATTIGPEERGPRGKGLNSQFQWARLPTSRASRVSLPHTPVGQRTEHQPKEDNSWALKSNGICPARFQTCLESRTSVFFPISPFWNGNVYPIVCPTDCILEAGNLYGFTGSQLNKIFALGWITPWLSSTFDLDGTQIRLGIYGWCWNGLKIWGCWGHLGGSVG